MLLCLLLECCLEYLSSRISIPRCSINFHTAQLINNINKYLKRAISRFSRSLHPLISCQTQCIKESEVDIYSLKSYPVLWFPPEITEMWQNFIQGCFSLLLLEAMRALCVLCWRNSRWRHFILDVIEIRQDRLEHLKLSNLVGGCATSPALSSNLRPEDINNNNST